MESKQDFIKRIVEDTTPEGHKLVIQTNYLACEQCGMRTLKNSAREKIKQLHQSPCWHGKWEAPTAWTGNPTHELQRRGNKVWCQICKACAIPKGSQRAASRQLQRPCEKATQQLQLPLCFQAKRATEQLI